MIIWITGLSGAGKSTLAEGYSEGRGSRVEGRGSRVEGRGLKERLLDY
jgi:adenylylsulfate kinase-like enzyme